MILYVRVQTNRAKIKEVIGAFSSKALPGEKFVAPRPLPGKIFRFYIGFGAVFSDSDNYKLLSSIKNFTVLSEAEYVSAVSEIKFSWTTPRSRV